jgi:hypothetical protein
MLRPVGRGNFLGRTGRFFYAHADDGVYKMATKRWITLVSISSVCVTALSMPAYSQQGAGICPALTHVVSAADSSFAGLSDDPAARPPAAQDAADCRASASSYDCQWQVWANADNPSGTASVALQALGADIAACLPEAVHDVNNPGRQHFYIKRGANRVTVTATAPAASSVRLVVTR